MSKIKIFTTTTHKNDECENYFLIKVAIQQISNCSRLVPNLFFEAQKRAHESKFCPSRGKRKRRIEMLCMDISKT